MTPGFTKFPSSWKVLWNRLLPWKKRLECPTVAEIMMATIQTVTVEATLAANEDGLFPVYPRPASRST
jgi:hypothetical protein